VAPPFARAGALVAVPDYPLAPAVRVDHIVMEVARAVAWVWRNARRYGGNPARIIVAGHSAGGHLATMMLALRWNQYASDLPADLVKGAVSLSGVFDLEPLRHAPFLAADLALDAQDAARLSPVHMPAPAGPLIALVGADESEEFLRQNRLIRKAWGAKAVPVCEAVPQRHHMNVLHDLADSWADLKGDQYYIKRLAATGGQTLRIDPPKLYVDGQVSELPSLQRVMSCQDGYAGYSNSSAGGGSFPILGSPETEYTVPRASYFALGDNSYHSSDSRYFGPVPEQNVVGRGLVVYWPFVGRWGLIN
jgi:signal peptidase I